MQVAIKTLFCIELTPEKVVEFCEEAGLLNALKHDNILHCYGVAVMPPAICLVGLLSQNADPLNYPCSLIS